MNFKTTLILFVLVVAGVFLWIYSGSEPESATDGPAPQEPLKTEYVFQPRVESHDILTLELHRIEKPALKFAREPHPDNLMELTRWRMIEPVECDAEIGLVNSLATLVEGLQYKRSFKPDRGEATLAQAGLDPPQAEIKLIERSGQEHTLQIGKSVPLSNDTYIRVAGRDEILVTSRYLENDLVRKTDEYRSKNPLNFAAGDVNRVLIEYEAQRFDFVRGVGAEWIINEPIKAHANGEAVKKLIEAASRLRIIEFADDQPESLEKYGLAAPVLSLTLSTEHTQEVRSDVAGPEAEPDQPTFKTVVETQTLLMGTFADLKSMKRYIKRGDSSWVALVSQAGLDKLVPKLSEFRDPKVTRLKADAVTALEITAHGQTAELTKQAGRWQGAGDWAEVESEAIRDLLRAVEDAAAIDFIDQPSDAATYGLDNPRAVLKITADNQVQPVILRIGSYTPSGHNAYAQIEGRETVLVINAARANELAVNPISLRSHAMTSLSPEGIRRVAIKHGERHYVIQRALEGGSWEMLEPADAPPDVNAIRALVNDLARLRAKRVTAKDADVEYGLDAPELVLEFESQREFEGPPSAEPEPAPTAVETVAHSLRVAPREDGIYAKLDDLPYIFEIDRTVYEVMSAEFIQAALFAIRSEDVVGVRIESPSGMLEFARVEEEWSYPPDPYVKLDAKKIDELVKGLAELRVAGYIAYQDAALGEHGLENAPLTVTLLTKDEATITLKIDQAHAADRACKAAWIEQRRIFLLNEDEVGKLLRELDEYIRPE